MRVVYVYRSKIARGSYRYVVCIPVKTVSILEDGTGFVGAEEIDGV